MFVSVWGIRVFLSVQIFVAVAQTIKGISRKGKEFFVFDTNLSETLSGLYVQDTRIWSTGEFVYNVFDNARDKHFYMAPDRINDMTCTRVTRDTEVDAVLACQDRKIRIMQTDFPVLECSVDQPATCIEPYPADASTCEFFGVPAGRTSMFLYGCQGGQVGHMTVRFRPSDRRLLNMLPRLPCAIVYSAEKMA